MSKKKVLSKFTILCWAAFIAILGYVQPAGCGLDTPARVIVQAYLAEASQNINIG